MENKQYEIVDSVEKLEEAIARTREAQRVFATYTQEQVDKIFLAAASAANKARIPLAKMAVEETGMGVVEDKVIKNNYAAEYIYNAYKDTKTCGVIEEDKAYGIKKIAEPIGVIAAVIPTTNPTSTAIFKCLLALKTRNAIIISPHPRAKDCTIAAAKLDLVQRAAVILAESGFDIEIVEKHHNQKIDAPSGTAMALADAINQAMDERYHYVYDRSQVREKREKTEIGIHAVRGGSIVGEHDVIFAGRDEVIELNHRATSREVFAVGAVKAAKFLAGKPAGLYSMKDALQ